MSLLGMLTAHIKPEDPTSHEGQIASVAAAMAGGSMAAALGAAAGAGLKDMSGMMQGGAQMAESVAAAIVPGAGMGGRGGVDFA